MTRSRTIISGRTLANRRLPLWSDVPAISLSVAGYSAYLGLPVILGGLSSRLGWDSGQLGWIGGLELCGLLLGAVFTSAIIASGRTIIALILAVAAAVAIDLATAFVSTFSVICALRVVAGFAGGVCYAGANSYLSQTQNPTQSFSHQAFAMVGFISLEIIGLQFAIDQWGVRGMFITMAAIYVAPAIFLPRLMKDRSVTSIAHDSKALNALPTAPPRLRLGWIGLGAVALYNVGTGCFWAFAQAMGMSAGLSGKFTATVLNVSNLCTLVTCLVAWRVAAHWGRQRPLILALVLIGIAMATWPFQLGGAGFSVWMFVYFQATALAAIYQLGVLSMLDPSGRMSALYPAALGAGLGTGPILGGIVLSSTSSFRQLLLYEAGVTGIAASVFIVIYVLLRRAVPVGVPPHL